jgi:hypothetical protein
MEASGIVPRAQEIEFKALEGSLSMMSKGEYNLLAPLARISCLMPLCLPVLNDVLDLYVSPSSFVHFSVLVW